MAQKKRKSSINFEQAGRHNFTHNDRTGKEPEHLLPKEHRKPNEILNTSQDAIAYLETLTKKAKENYQKTIGQKLQAKKFIWEAEVNLLGNHTMEDVVKLAKAIEKETGFTTLQVAIHRDEGRINSRGFPVYNYHAHITCFTLDRETGQQLWRRNITKKQKERQPNLLPMNRERLSKLQDLTAEILNMQRGEKGSKHKHLKPAVFRELKEKEEYIKKLELEAYDHDTILPEYNERGTMIDGEFYHPSYKEQYEALKNQNQVLTQALSEKDAQIANMEAEIAKLKDEAINYIEKLEEGITPVPSINPW